MNELDKWWSSLSTREKERIATKAARKAGETTTEIRYPACTTWWLSIDEYRKKEIHDHCTDRHGLLLPEWQEGRSMSY